MRRGAWLRLKRAAAAEAEARAGARREQRAARTDEHFENGLHLDVKVKQLAGLSARERAWALRGAAGRGGCSARAATRRSAPHLDLRADVVAARLRHKDGRRRPVLLGLRLRANFDLGDAVLGGCGALGLRLCVQRRQRAAGAAAATAAAALATGLGRQRLLVRARRACVGHRLGRTHALALLVRLGAPAAAALRAREEAGAWGAQLRGEGLLSPMRRRFRARTAGPCAGDCAT